jgi:hypothetical protein
MSELLEKAEAYYMVAADLRRQGESQLEMARYLSGVADRMCEENMRQKKPPDSAGASPDAVD